MSISWTDPTSGLTWQNPLTMNTMIWLTAKQYCADLNLGGYTDWHLPTIDELRTLIRGCPSTELGGSCNVKEGVCLAASCKEDASCFGCSYMDGPGEDGCYWPDKMEGLCMRYWSSSLVEESDDWGWRVDFVSGSVDFFGGYLPNVRCVR